MESVDIQLKLLELVDITQHNKEVFENLAQGYEAEFSSLTHKRLMNLVNLR